MNHRLQVATPKTVDCIDRLFQQLQAVRQPGAVVTLDLARIDLVTPDGVIALVMAAES